MRVSIHSLVSLVTGVADTDGNGVLSVGDRVTVETQGEKGRVQTQHEVYEESIASAHKLAKYLSALSGRQVNVLTARGNAAYFAYSTKDGAELAGIADAVTGEDYNFEKLDARYLAPDYARGYPGGYKDLELRRCKERLVDKERAECAVKVENNYQTLLQLSQTYDVERTRLQDQEVALNQLFLSGALSVEGFQSLIDSAKATETAWSKYVGYDL